jgi:hypothetical protein
MRAGNALDAHSSKHDSGSLLSGVVQCMSVEQTPVHMNAADFSVAEILAVCTLWQEVLDIAKETGDCDHERSS